MCFADYAVRCDSRTPCIYATNPTTRQTYGAWIESNGQPLGTPSSIVPIITPANSTQEFIVTIDKDMYHCRWDMMSPVAQLIKSVQTIDDGNPRSRIGLMHRDISGRSLYVPYGDASLCGEPVYNATVFLYRKGQNFTQVLKDMGLPGGFAFSLDGKTLYVLDVCLGLIVCFRIDCDGDICK